MMGAAKVVAKNRHKIYKKKSFGLTLAEKEVVRFVGRLRGTAWCTLVDDVRSRAVSHLGLMIIRQKRTSFYRSCRTETSMRRLNALLSCGCSW